ncbi:tetratricopeptide repeat protein [Streptomyces albus]|uniref:tetratricopeptide repeat protein n=1 Tax=Streptomyces albus TaxID=1888 RepID=UPI0033BFC4FF
MTANRLSGTVHGSAVQASTVHGGVHVHVSTHRRHVVPRQLPPVTGVWTDREQELEELRALVAAQDPHASVLVVLSGPGGIGKTALAARWLAEHQDLTPDGQLYADLSAAPGPSTASRHLRPMLHALGHPADVDEAELTGWWRTWTAHRRLALLLDNAGSVAEVQALLPGGGGHLIVVTARKPLSGLVLDGAHLHRLAPLGPTAALALFGRLVGRGRLAADPAAARALTDRCGGVPLHLGLAAARLADQPAVPLATAAATTEKGLSVIDQIYEQLPPDVARAHRLLATLPAVRLDVHAVSAALACPAPDAQQVLAALADRRLVEPWPGQPSGPVYRLHDEVAGHARRAAALADPPEARTEALRRWLDWLLATTSRAERILTPAHRQLARDVHFLPPAPPFAADDQDGAREWLIAHGNDVAAAVHAAHGRGWHAMVWQLVHAAWPLWRLQRPLELWVQMHELGLAAARECQDRLAQREMLTTGVIALRGLGNYDSAADWAQTALDLARDDDDERGQAQAWHELGTCWYKTGRCAEASSALETAISIRTRIGYARGVALSQLVLGQLALDTGQPSRAADLLSRARAGLRAAGDTLDAARATALLGRAHAALGRHEDAEQLLRTALADMQRIGARPWHGRVLAMLGQTAEERGQRRRAAQWYRRALAVLEPASPRDAARVRDQLAHCQPADTSNP